MASRKDKKEKLTCPKCGVVLNRHASKQLKSVTREEAAGCDPDLGVTLEEHTCPGCGVVECRRG